jgi:aminopeptidase
MIHVDFMIGTEDLSVIAHTRDGRSVPLFENGDWAF